MSRTPLEPVRVAEALRECPGKWVALKGGSIVEVQDTPYRLIAALKERGIQNATVIRAPGEGEAELVGLG